MFKNFYRFLVAVATLPIMFYRFRKACRKADFHYRAMPTRYYVLLSAPSRFVVTSKEHIKELGTRPVRTNSTSGISRPASGGDLQRDCYYFTPTKYGAKPKNYHYVLQQKFHKLLRHHFGM